MNKVAFIVPTYINHFEHSYKMEKTFSELNLNADLFLLFTDLNESLQFNATFAKKIFLLDDFPRGVDNRGIITIKKLQGVEFAMLQGYEYAIVLDSETTFIKKFDAYAAAKYLSDRKIIYSTTTSHHILIEINRRCTDFFNGDEIKRLEKITKNFTEFFWFNDLAFYDLSICDKFFKNIYKEDGLKNFYAKMSSAHFDHIIYVYHCLLYESYKLINLNEDMGLPLMPFEKFHLGILESIGDRSTRNKIPENLSKDIIKKLNPFWLPYGTDFKNENCFMLFHFDRA